MSNGCGSPRPAGFTTAALYGLSSRRSKAALTEEKEAEILWPLMDFLHSIWKMSHKANINVVICPQWSELWFLQSAVVSALKADTCSAVTLEGQELEAQVKLLVM